MLITYQHDDGNVASYSTDDLSAVEAAAVESVTGMEWGDVEHALRAQKPTPMRAIVWVFTKRQQPTLRFSDFDVPGWRRRLKARLEYPEIEDLLEQLLRDAKGETTDDVIGEMTHYMRKFAADPADVDKALAELAPKATPVFGGSPAGGAPASGESPGES